ncbi:hypothetical protein [Streptomyces antibioticus]|uniref:hypothetical protein n=1 Tax=Streptomyces antibioticus TaxID=1890 RepID=UPI003F4D3D60
MRGLLVVDWVAPHGLWDDQIAFVFDGGTVEGVDQLTPHDDELSEARFVGVAEAGELVRGRLAEAVRAAREGRAVYLHDGLVCP